MVQVFDKPCIPEKPTAGRFPVACILQGVANYAENEGFTMIYPTNSNRLLHGVTGDCIEYVALMLPPNSSVRALGVKS